jgi:hypothetical protein
VIFRLSLDHPTYLPCNLAIRQSHANFHYAGHGPATVKLFMDLWDQKK